jgi:hypothetical protein
MRWRDILLSVAAPIISWLLLGGPRLDLTGNLALFLVLIAHFYAVIWNDLMFRFFRGDRFTYGAVAMSLNMVSLAASFLAVWITMHFAGKRLEHLHDISPYIWGLIALSMLATIVFPVLTQRNVAALPNESERRVFEDPTKTSDQERL